VYFSLSNLVDQLKQQAYGTIFDTITTRTFQDTEVIHPSQETMSAFERTVDPLMASILNNTVASRTLAALRDALLPKLISGETRVRDVERFLRERDS